MFAVAVIHEDMLKKLPNFNRRLQWVSDSDNMMTNCFALLCFARHCTIVKTGFDFWSIYYKLQLMKYRADLVANIAPLTSSRNKHYLLTLLNENQMKRVCQCHIIFVKCTKSQSFCSCIGP
jgi:hypothetical protein